MQTNFEYYKEDIKRIREKSETLNAYPAIVHNMPVNCCGTSCNTCDLYISNCHTCDRNGFLDWALKEYREDILDEIEKKYLKSVIRPFREKIKYIAKFESYTGKGYVIYFKLNNDTSSTLPIFSKKTKMYAGMKVDNKYTVDELGL